MSHFAKVEDGIVTQVIVSEQDFVDTQEGTWVQTSYNTRGGKHYTDGVESADQSKAFRGNYAARNKIWDEDNQLFYGKQPYPSWTLNTTTAEWDPPTPYPSTETEGPPDTYNWNESTKTWDEVVS